MKTESDVEVHTVPQIVFDAFKRKDISARIWEKKQVKNQTLRLNF